MIDEMKLAKLSVLLNSAVRMNTSNKGVRTAAYRNTMKVIEDSLPKSSPDIFERKSSKYSQKPAAFKKREGRENELKSRSFDSKDIKKSAKRRMKWKDYLALQVEKQRKLNESLASPLKKTEKPEQEKPCPKPVKPTEQKTMKIKEFEKELDKFKPVKIVDNFKKLDEQEGFLEEPEKPDPDIEENLNEAELKEPGEERKESGDEQDEDDKRIKEIIQRYERTFGKIKIEIKKPNQSVLAASVSGKSEQRSKSVFSNYSTETQKEAVEKLKALEEEEKKIQEKKEELLRFLESRSQKRDPSRPVTVSSIISINSIKEKADLKDYHKTNVPVLPQVRVERPSTSKGSVKSSKKPAESEIKELLSSLI